MRTSPRDLFCPRLGSGGICSRARFSVGWSSTVLELLHLMAQEEGKTTRARYHQHEDD